MSKLKNSNWSLSHPAYNNPVYINKFIIRAPAFQLRRHVWRISADWRELSCWLQMHCPLSRPRSRGKNVSDVMLPKLRPCFTLGITHAAIHITHAVCTRAIKESSRSFTESNRPPPVTPACPRCVRITSPNIRPLLSVQSLLSCLGGGIKPHYNTISAPVQNSSSPVSCLLISENM